MMLNIHNIQSIEVSTENFEENWKRRNSFSTKTLRITDDKGMTFEITLFSDSQDKLKFNE